jgi:hypothetical protein
MKPGILLLWVLTALASWQPALGQALPSHRDVFPTGASVTWGVGPVALRDEYISTQRYAGSLPSLTAEWARFHQRNGFRVEMDLATSSDVRNYSVSTDVTEFALDLDFLYPAGSVSLGSRRVYLFLGPSAGVGVLVNDQQIASQGMEVALSFASLFSLGAVGDMVLPITPRLQALGSLRLALFSACIRMVDLMEDDEESPLKLLGPLSASRGVGSLGLRFRTVDWLSLGLGYEGSLLRVTPWNPLISHRDHLTFTLTLGR